MVTQRAFANLGGQVSIEPEDAEHLASLIRDYERWGLAPEAEAARLRYRNAVLRDLLWPGRAGPFKRDRPAA